MTIEVQDNTCGLVTSQESTKIYHCEEDLVSVQTFTGIIGRHALLCILPDYLVCYKDARYHQQQKFEMSSDGNLVCLDWLTAGRIARDESWEFTKYLNRTEIQIDGELVFKDCVQLEDMPSVSIKESMTKYMATGTCLLLGKKLQIICDKLEEKFARRKKYGESYETDKIVSVSKLNYERCNIPVSGLYIRFMAINTTLAFSIISEIVELLLPILGSDPYQNKY